MTQANTPNFISTNNHKGDHMMPTTILLSTREQEALTVLLNSMTSDDVEKILARSFGELPEGFDDIVYDVWSVADDLHRTLLDREFLKEAA